MANWVQKRGVVRQNRCRFGHVYTRYPKFLKKQDHIAVNYFVGRGCVEDDAKQMVIANRVQELPGAPVLITEAKDFIAAKTKVPDNVGDPAAPVAHDHKMLPLQLRVRPHGGGTAPPFWNKPSS